MTKQFWLGCAVWSHRDWLGNFLPAGTPNQALLAQYSRRVTAVEGNTTFYAVPKTATVQRWATQVPPQFRFCLKLHQRITHSGLLYPQAGVAQQFLTLMQPLQANLGPYFAQLPPRYSPANLADLTDFLSQWPTQSAPLALEVRHLGWFQPTIADRLQAVLRDRGIGRVLLDTRPIYDGDDDPQRRSKRRKPRVPLQPIVTAPFTIVRYISHPVLERNRDYLAGWVEHIRDWLAQDIAVYFFVHCPDESRSPLILREFHTRLTAAQVPVPPLPWDECPDDPAPTQLSLF